MPLPHDTDCPRCLTMANAKREIKIREVAATGDLKGQIERAQGELAEIEAKLAERESLQSQALTTRERKAELRAENERLKVEMQELKGRIGKLQVATGAVCPLCGQSLSEEHRRSTLEGLEEEGRSKGDRYRANQAEAKALAEQITEHEAGIKALGFAEQNRLATSNSISQLSERLEGNTPQDDGGDEPR